MSLIITNLLGFQLDLYNSSGATSSLPSSFTQLLFSISKGTKSTRSILPFNLIESKDSPSGEVICEGNDISIPSLSCKDKSHSIAIGATFSNNNSALIILPILPVRGTGLGFDNQSSHSLILIPVIILIRLVETASSLFSQGAISSKFKRDCCIKICGSIFESEIFIGEPSAKTELKFLGYFSLKFNVWSIKL